MLTHDRVARTVIGVIKRVSVDLNLWHCYLRLVLENCTVFSTNFRKYPSKQLPVEGAVLDCFGDVVLVDRGGGGEVGDGAADFEDAVIGAGMWQCKT